MPKHDSNIIFLEDTTWEVAVSGAREIDRLTPAILYFINAKPGEI